MTARIVVVTGTGTDVGKTIAVAALTAAAKANGLRVGVCKPAQTGVAPGEPGDLAVVTALAGDVPTREAARYREPLAPETAARRGGLPFVTIDDVRAAVTDLAAECDLVIVEGAGGVLVRFAPDLTLLDLARDLDARLLVVTDPGLGTLNHTELTVREIRRAGLDVDGLILGSWPAAPDLAMTCNRDDLHRLTGVPIVAVLPAGSGSLAPADFQNSAPAWVHSPIVNPIAQPGAHK
ncbi:ATP-dependent dethiobiotin synthetase BioD [Gordonia spumicola]|uniref:ATP-dependent dethiobiotin synthetase BioD n=1 Tax=Gordonia spumicola TaxID=589161 RepID=A0A7I9VD57_9ACTN|nr:dethiobiotin synthase [Gordonia spumicola]GEE03298.1 ATP-dependent dethiobiotin synthetase BioD [Gordonia spumicola]